MKFSDPTGAFDWDTNTIQPCDTLSQITNDFNAKFNTSFTCEDFSYGLGISDPNYIKAGDSLNLNIFKPATEEICSSEPSISNTNGENTNQNNSFDISGLSDFKEPIGKLGDLTSYFDEGLKKLGKGSKSLSNFTTALGIISFTYDLIYYKLDPYNVENMQNCVVDMVGAGNFYTGLALRGYYTLLNNFNENYTRNSMKLIGDDFIIR